MYIMCLSKGLSAILQSIDGGVLPHKKLGFIPTAGDTYENPYFVDESRQRLKLHDIEIVEMDLANESRQEIVQKLDTVDGIYVAGGNSFYLLYQLQQEDLVNEIRHRVQGGLAYFGESAGAVLLAKSIEPAKIIDDPAKAPLLDSYDALNLIDFFPLPHCDREKYKPVFDKFIDKYQHKIDIIKYTDDQAIVTTDGKNYKIVASDIEQL